MPVERWMRVSMFKVEKLVQRRRQTTFKQRDIRHAYRNGWHAIWKFITEFHTRFAPSLWNDVDMGIDPTNLLHLATRISRCARSLMIGVFRRSPFPSKLPHLLCAVLAPFSSFDFPSIVCMSDA